MTLKELYKIADYKDSHGMLFHGDCLEIMKNIEDESIDMILCDLPYGTSACKWDSVIPFGPLWEQYSRIIKPFGAIVLFGSEPFSSALRLSNLDMYKYDWKWEKPNGANFLNFKYQPAKVHEDIMVFGKSATSHSKKGNMIYNPQMTEGTPYNQKSGQQRQDNGHVLGSAVRSPIKQVYTENNGTRYPRSIQRFPLDKDKLHPTQKPVALLEYLVKTYTNEGNVVLDNCMGSGSTGVSCINTNRRFIGIELDENYFNIAKERIENNHVRIQSI